MAVHVYLESLVWANFAFNAWQSAGIDRSNPGYWSKTMPSSDLSSTAMADWTRLMMASGGDVGSLPKWKVPLPFSASHFGGTLIPVPLSLLPP